LGIRSCGTFVSAAEDSFLAREKFWQQNAAADSAGNFHIEILPKNSNINFAVEPLEMFEARSEKDSESNSQNNL
jgi:hypothetical protein